MSEDKKIIIYRLFEQLNRGNYGVIDELLSASFQTNLPDVPHGREGYKQWLIETSEMELAAFGALSQTGVEHMEETGDLVKVWTISRSPEFVMRSDTPEIWRIVGGKIIEHIADVSEGPEAWRK